MRGMRNAEDILNVIRDRGRRGLPLGDVYRQLYKPELYLRAYGRLYRNEGAMTKGVTPETVDGMSLEKIERTIEALRSETYRWTPARRVQIPKVNQPGKTRPLGIPTWSDKLLQEVMRSILEAYYEPQFSPRSHGFRPGRGCHTALKEVSDTWKGTRWFIEGDIKGCFDNIDHSVLLDILRERIHDNRIIRLLEAMFKAGYLEDWVYKPTHSGTPQGGVISPILANIYLDRLDQYVEQTLIPDHTRGKKRAHNMEYVSLQSRARRARERGDHDTAKALEKQFRGMPCGDPNDPNYRRLRYVRYADDFMLGFIGPRAEAEAIRDNLKQFLADTLHLELSTEKTLITQASTQAAHFLGYEIVARHDDSWHDSLGRRVKNRQIGLRVPARVVEEKCRTYMRGGKAIHRPELLSSHDYSIVVRYQSEYRGIVQYYQLAENVAWFSKLKWTMETSLLKTLANKHKTSVAKLCRKHRTKVMTDHGPRSCIQVTLPREGKEPLTAYFGGVSLRTKRTAIIRDQIGNYIPPMTELVQRLMAQECEVCGSTEKIEVHHIRKLADLKKPGRREKPFWAQLMAARQRKTLVLCQTCHHDTHLGRLRQPVNTE